MPVRHISEREWNRNTDCPPAAFSLLILTCHNSLALRLSKILADLYPSTSFPWELEILMHEGMSAEMASIWGKNSKQKKKKKKFNSLGLQLDVLLQFTALSVCFITPLLKFVTKSQPQNSRMEKSGMG